MKVCQKKVVTSFYIDHMIIFLSIYRLTFSSLSITFINTTAVILNLNIFFVCCMSSIERGSRSFLSCFRSSFLTFRINIIVWRVFLMITMRLELVRLLCCLYSFDIYLLKNSSYIVSLWQFCRNVSHILLFFLHLIYVHLRKRD